MTPPSPPARLLALLALVLTLVWFGPLDMRKLVKPDEGRYAEIPREMVATGDWLTPRLNGIKYFEKPPLQYWATATAYTAFGQHEWTARLWPAVTGFAGVLLTAFAGTVLFGASAGLLAAAVLASSLLYLGMGHINTLDMGVSFFLQLALFAFLLAQRSEADSSAETRWMLVAWAAGGLAVLSKGLIGLVFPAATLVAYSVLTRDFSAWRRLHVFKGLLLLLAITVPWFVAVSLANPEFPRFFFYHEHIERFLTTQHRRVEPWWYFGQILLLGLFPWTTVVLGAVGGWKRSLFSRGLDTSLFLLLWSAIVFVFFSLSGSKLPSYILPMLPALALVTGDHLAHMDGARLRRHLWPVLVLALAGAVLLPHLAVNRGEAHSQQALAAYGTWLSVACGMMAAGAALALWLARPARPGHRAPLTLALAGLFGASVAVVGHDTLNRSTSAWELARTVRPLLNADVPFYSVLTYEQTLPFYLGRTLTLVEFTDELAFGLEQEPHLAIAKSTDWEQRWVAGGDAFALFTPDTYDALRKRGLPMTLVARDPRRIIVRKPAAP